MSRRSALTFVLAVASTACQSRSDDARIAECERTIGGALEADRVRVFVASRVEGANLVPGRLARCADSSQAVDAFVSARDALVAIPPPLRPPAVDIHVVPPTDAPRRIEYRPASKALLLGRGVDPFERGVWLHEIAHVRAGGARPGGRTGRRVLAAVDEGFADYFAAFVMRSPRVGGGLEERDLTRAPPISAADWAELALERSRFDPHRLGHALAAVLWALEPTDSVLLGDVADALASPRPYGGASDTPRAVLEELVRRSRPRSRALFARALARWSPDELFSVETRARAADQ